MVPRMSESSGNAWKHVEVCKVAQRVGNRVAEFGFECFCPDYVSKIGVSVTERNSLGLWASLAHLSHAYPTGHLLVKAMATGASTLISACSLWTTLSTHST